MPPKAKPSLTPATNETTTDQNVYKNPGLQVPYKVKLVAPMNQVKQTAEAEEYDQSPDPKTEAQGAKVWEDTQQWEKAKESLCSAFKALNSKDWATFGRLLDDGGQFSKHVSSSIASLEEDRKALNRAHKGHWEMSIVQGGMESFLGDVGSKMGIARFSGPRYSLSEMMEFRRGVLHHSGLTLNRKDQIWPEATYLEAKK